MEEVCIDTIAGVRGALAAGDETPLYRRGRKVSIYAGVSDSGSGELKITDHIVPLLRRLADKGKLDDVEICFLSRHDLVDLSPLDGLALGRVSLSGCINVVDVSPLRNVDCVSLRCANSVSADSVAVLRENDVTIEGYYAPGAATLNPMFARLLAENSARNMEAFLQAEYSRNEKNAEDGPTAAPVAAPGEVEEVYLKTVAEVHDALAAGDETPLYRRGRKVSIYAGASNSGSGELKITDHIVPLLRKLAEKGKLGDVEISFLSRHDLVDLSPLDGLALGRVSLSGCINVVDVSPLRNVDCVSLRCTKSVSADSVAVLRENGVTIERDDPVYLNALAAEFHVKNMGKIFRDLLEKK